MSATRTSKQPSAPDQPAENGEGNLHNTSMAVAEAIAALKGFDRAYAPVNSKQLVQNLAAAANLTLDQGFSPSPFGSSHPDHSTSNSPDPRKYQENPNRQPLSRQSNRYRELLLEVNYMNAYVVQGKINGRSASFLVDTGATHVSIPERVARALGLEPLGRAGTSSTANGTITVYPTQIRELRLGDIVLHHVSASINTADRGHQILLGMSALGELEMQQKQGKLLLRQPLNRKPQTDKPH